MDFTLTILAAALEKGGYDLILAGRQAIGGDTAQVGPQVAERVGIPQITYAAGIPVWGFNDLKGGLNPEWIGLHGSPATVVKSFPKQMKVQGTKLAGLSADEAAAAIVQKLDEISVI